MVKRKVQTDEARSERIRQWTDARNTGIREGLLMAMSAVAFDNSGSPCVSIEARGDRHFNGSEWRK